MNKQTLKTDWFNTSSIVYASITMVLFSLLVSFGVELLIKSYFS